MLTLNQGEPFTGSCVKLVVEQFVTTENASELQEGAI